MNELIEQLWDTHCRFVDGKHAIGYEYFIQAIQTACKAQRNACARVYVSANCDFDACEDILNAKIEKEDYE